MNVPERIRQYKRGCLRARMQPPYVYTLTREEQRNLVEWLQSMGHLVDSFENHTDVPEQFRDMPNLIGRFDTVYLVAEEPQRDL